MRGTPSGESGGTNTAPRDARFLAALICAATALVAAIRLWMAGSPPEPYLLWLLAALICFFVLRDHPARQEKTDRAAAWMIVAAAVIIALFVPVERTGFPLWAGLLAALAWTVGIRQAGRLSVAILIFTVILPSISLLHTLISFPLARISAAFSAWILRLFGSPARADLAILHVGEHQIAVTAACSGIELLDAMLLLGWLTVYFEHRRFVFRLLHFLTLLPIIVFCNTLRLVLVTILFLMIGEVAFNNTLHHIMGYGVIVAAILILFAVGKIFTLPEETER